MTLLVLGIGLGLITVIPLGPVSLTVVGIGVAQGRQRGSLAGIGVAAGDLISASAAIVTIVAGSTLPPAVFDGLRYASLAVLMFFAGLMVFGANRLQSVAGRVQRPARTMLAITSLSPLTFGSWVAMFLAMPFANEPSALAVFAVGVVLASTFWHVLLGAGAGAIGPRLNDRTVTIAARFGGILLAGLGCVLFTAL